MSKDRVRSHTQHNAMQKQDRTKTLISDPPPQRSRRSRWVSSKVQSQNALTSSDIERHCA